VEQSWKKKKKKTKEEFSKRTAKAGKHQPN